MCVESRSNEWYLKLLRHTVDIVESAYRFPRLQMASVKKNFIERVKSNEGLKELKGLEVIMVDFH